MDEKITLNDWLKLSMMLEDRNIYSQEFVDGVYDKLQSLVKAADERIKQEYGKKYEVGFDVVNKRDHLLDVMLTVPIIYVACPSDCIEQSLRSDQPTACTLLMPWLYDGVDDLCYHVGASIRSVDNKVRAQLLD